jgi:hypothetical protein
MDTKEPQSSPIQTGATNSESSKKVQMGRYGPIGYNNFANYLAENLLKPGETWLSRAQRPLTPEEKEAHRLIEERCAKLGLKFTNPSGSTGISGSEQKPYGIHALRPPQRT